MILGGTETAVGLLSGAEDRPGTDLRAAQFEARRRRACLCRPTLAELAASVAETIGSINRVNWARLCCQMAQGEGEQHVQGGLMQRIIGFVVACWMCVTPIAYADVHYDNGRVVQHEEYDGPPLLADAYLPLAGAVGGSLLYQWTPMVGLAVIPISVITWGAWRTERYRSDDVKASMHNNLERALRRPVRGSVDELL